MEFKITKQCLSSALSKTAPIADRKSSMQIISNVLMEAQNGDHVRIAATDLNISAFGLFPAQVVDGGAITISAKTLYDVVRNMPDGLIVIRTDGDQAIVEGGRSHFRLLTLPAEDFPVLPSVAGIDFFNMDISFISNMIENTVFSISGDETRLHLNGALFQGDGKNLRMVTTDGHRLSKVEVRIEESGFYNFSMVIPNKGIQEIKRLVEDGEGVISIGTRDGSVFLKRDIEIEKGGDGMEQVFAEFTLVSKLIDSEFPPYDQVIPKGNDKNVLVSRTAFLDSLKRVSVLSSEKIVGVKFQLSSGVLDILTNNPSIGEGAEQIDVTYDGEDLTIGFNARYLIDILNVLDDAEVRLELSGPLDPVIVNDQSGKFIGVVMPMRI